MRPFTSGGVADWSTGANLRARRSWQFPAEKIIKSVNRALFSVYERSQSPRLNLESRDFDDRRK